TLARRYADTPAAAEAGEALKRLGTVVPRPAPAPAATTKPAPAVAAGDGGAQLLQLARSYHTAGMTAKARDKLAELIRSRPDSESARQARELLAKWDAKQGG
ncbi:MAG TPA: hypothetical protein VFJ30_04425, partial [Phycisphaerae bacterium]|nr:hypothetical protein [Phycisphaerae bacterium]